MARCDVRRLGLVGIGIAIWGATGLGVGCRSSATPTASRQDMAWRSQAGQQAPAPEDATTTPGTGAGHRQPEAGSGTQHSLPFELETLTGSGQCDVVEVIVEEVYPLRYRSPSGLPATPVAEPYIPADMQQWHCAYVPLKMRVTAVYTSTVPSPTGYVMYDDVSTKTCPGAAGVFGEEGRVVGIQGMLIMDGHWSPDDGQEHSPMDDYMFDLAEGLSSGGESWYWGRHVDWYRYADGHALHAGEPAVSIEGLRAQVTSLLDQWAPRDPRLRLHLPSSDRTVPGEPGRGPSAPGVSGRAALQAPYSAPSGRIDQSGSGAGRAPGLGVGGPTR